LPAANAVLDRFCADYNRRFARPPAQAACDFRSLPRRFDLARCLALHYPRVVAPDHTVTLGASAIALPPLPGHRGSAGETVELSHQLEGMLRVYRGDRCGASGFFFSARCDGVQGGVGRVLRAAAAERALENRVSLQFIRHFLVATTCPFLVQSAASDGSRPSNATH